MPYGNTTPDEDKKIDKCIAGISGTNPKTHKPYTKSEKIAICKSRVLKKDEGSVLKNDAGQMMSEEITLSLSTGKARKFEFLANRSDATKRVMRFELMDNAELYNGVRFTKEALQHQLEIFNKKEFLVTHGMNHSGEILHQLGKVTEMTMEEHEKIATVYIVCEDYMETPAQVQAEILYKQGLLDYISGGWRASIAFNEETKEYEVYKPVFREVSSTPIPAKTSAKAIENVCMDIMTQLSLNHAPNMEVKDMSEEEPKTPSPTEGIEEATGAEIAALKKRLETQEKLATEMNARQVSQERTSLLERAAELGLAETDFAGVLNDTIRKSLEVANKVKMSTLRASDPDIPLGSNGTVMQDGSPELVAKLIKENYNFSVEE